MLMGPGFSYDLMVEKATDAEVNDLDISCIKIIYNGAEPVRMATMQQFAKHFKTQGARLDMFSPCYGLAETTLMLTVGEQFAAPVQMKVDIASLEKGKAVAAQPGKKSTTLVSSGRNILQNEAIVVDPQNRTRCPDLIVGEIWAKGPTVAKGYWNNPQETEKVFKAKLHESGSVDANYLRTGDLGFMNNGDLFVTGRLKDVIIIRGLNYYPQDIELVAEQSHEMLAKNAAAAFSIEEQGEEKPVVVVEADRKARAITAAEAGEILKLVSRQVWQIHELVIFDAVLLKPGALPKTSSGKVQRQLCKQLYLDNRLKEITRLKPR